MQEISRRRGEALTERFAQLTDDRAVVSGIGEHDNDLVDATVALALPDAPHQLLDVAHPGLGLNPDEKVIETQNDVPGAAVVDVWKRHLARLPERWMDDSAEPRDQRLLALVAQSVADRMKGETISNPSVDASAPRRG